MCPVRQFVSSQGVFSHVRLVVCAAEKVGVCPFYSCDPRRLLKIQCVVLAAQECGSVSPPSVYLFMRVVVHIFSKLMHCSRSDGVSTSLEGAQARNSNCTATKMHVEQKSV